MPGIIVGMDGSGHSHRALEWAIREAAVRQAPLTVITVVPVAVSTWTGISISSEADQPEKEAIRKVAEEAVQKAVGEAGEPRPASVTVRVLAGVPARELVDASRDADLLVVGSRGAGGFARLMIGSVSGQVVNHAFCPVVVIPHDR